MSCISTIVLVFVSRIAIILWWIADRPLFALAFKNWVIPGSITIPTWIYPIIGFVFLPVTTLAYLFLFPGGITGYEWIVLGIAVIIDLAGHGGTYYHRSRFPVMRRSAAL